MTYQPIWNVTLAIDIMYVNKTIPFIITTSCAIHFGKAQMMKNEKIYHDQISQTNHWHIQCKRIYCKTYIGRWAIWVSQKIPGMIRHNTQHHCPRWTCPKSRKIHLYNKRKNAGNNEHINIWITLTLTNCWNYIQHSLFGSIAFHTEMA